MGKSNKVCPNCGREMKQQFIGLQHCKCGMSWKKGASLSTSIANAHTYGIFLKHRINWNL